jgi:anthranilate synthase component II
MLLMIDNYDSFTYNVVQYFGEIDPTLPIEVVRNDQIKLDDIDVMAPKYLVISPGPCTPNEAGISLAVIERYADKLPLLGICLGHQSIAQAFGGRIVRAKRVMHGKTSPIYHNNHGVFENLPNPFIATRYHSLVIEQDSLPECLEITAWTQNEGGAIDEIMGVRHKEFSLEGVQFHPESILTEHGHQLLNNFLTRYQ